MKTTIGHEIPASHHAAVLIRRAPTSADELPQFDRSFETRGQARTYVAKGGTNGADGRYTVALDHQFRDGTYRSTFQRREVEL